MLITTAITGSTNRKRVMANSATKAIKDDQAKDDR